MSLKLLGRLLHSTSNLVPQGAVYWLGGPWHASTGAALVVAATVVVVASVVVAAVSVVMAVVVSDATRAVVVATAVSVLLVSEAESVTASISIDSVAARDVNRTVVVTTDDEGRHGPALTPTRAIKAMEPEIKWRRATTKSETGR